MFLEELRDLPTLYPSLTDIGFFVSGFTWFVDWVVFPLATAALRLRPRQVPGTLTALAAWGLRTVSRGPFGTVLQAEAVESERLLAEMRQMGVRIDLRELER